MNAYLIARLRRDAETPTASISGIQISLLDAADALEAAEAEVARLRAALELIAERRSPYGVLPRTAELGWAEHVAREALGPSAIVSS